MMLTPLQLPSVHYNPSCHGCAHDPEEKKENAKKEFCRPNVERERLSVIQTFG